MIELGYTKTARSPVSTTKPTSKIRKTDYGAIPSKKECPNCGSEKFRRYLDGSGYCENCGKTFRGDQGFKSESEQGSDQDKPS